MFLSLSEPELPAFLAYQRSNPRMEDDRSQDNFSPAGHLRGTYLGQ
jgi:hypothetical protein